MTVITGTSTVIKNLKNFSKLSKKAIELGVFLTANEVKSLAQKSIQQRSIGEPQLRASQGGTQRRVIASRAGDAPNTDTGALVQSIAVEHNETVAYVGSNIRYAEHLELGTRHMKARPFLVPALESVNGSGGLVKNIKKAAKAIV